VTSLKCLSNFQVGYNSSIGRA